MAQVLIELIIIDYGGENGINEHIAGQYPTRTFCGHGPLPYCTFVKVASGDHGIGRKGERPRGWGRCTLKTVHTWDKQSSLSPSTETLGIYQKRCLLLMHCYILVTAKRIPALASA